MNINQPELSTTIKATCYGGLVARYPSPFYLRLRYRTINQAIIRRASDKSKRDIVFIAVLSHSLI